MRTLHVVSLAMLLLLAACGGDEEGNGTTSNNQSTPDVDAGNSDTGDGNNTSTDAGTSPDMGPPPTDPVGRLNLTYWGADALYDFPELHGHAVFSPSLAEANVVDPVGWLAYQNGWDVFIADDYWAVPEGSDGQPAGPADLGVPADFLDAGELVAVGEWVDANRSVEVFEADGVPIYDFVAEFAPEAAEREDLTAPLALIVDGGADIRAAEIADAITMPAAFEFTSHDPLQRLPVRYGVDVVIDWQPSPSPDDYVVAVLSTFTEDRVWRVDDAAGSFDLSSAAAESNIVIDDDTVVSFSRILDQEVQLPDGVLHVTASRKQWFYAKSQGPWAVEPKVWPTGATTPVRLELIDSPADPVAPPTIDVGSGVTIENIVVADDTGRLVTFDAVVDPTAESGRRNLVVDSGALLDIPNAIWVAEPLENAGDCASSVDEGGVADGTYFATDEGLENGQFPTDACGSAPIDGREQAIPVDLLAGQTLTATVLNDDAGAVLYVTDSCAGNFTPECVVAPRRGIATTLTYVAEYDHTALLVVDGVSTPDAPSASYAIDIRRSAPQPFVLFPDLVTEGGQPQFEILSFVGDFTATDTADFGPDVTVDFFDPLGDLAVIDASVSNTPASRVTDVTLTVGGVSHTVADALRIGAFLGTPDSCMSADSVGAIGPGSYEGITFGGGSDAVTPVPCLSGNADGSEAIYRVDIPAGHTLRARVVMPGLDPVLYIVEACDAAVLTCADNSGSGGSEWVEWTGPPTDSSVYLVVDGFDFGDTGSFFLDVEVVQ